MGKTKQGSHKTNEIIRAWKDLQEKMKRDKYVYLSCAGQLRRVVITIKRNSPREEKRSLYPTSRACNSLWQEKFWNINIGLTDKKIKCLVMSFVKLKWLPTESSSSQGSWLVSALERGHIFLWKGRRWWWEDRASNEEWTDLPGSLCSSFLPVWNSLCLLLPLLAIQCLNLTVVTRELFCLCICWEPANWGCWRVM